MLRQGMTLLGLLDFILDSGSVAGEEFAPVRVKGNIFLVADDGLSAFVDGARSHAEKGFFRVVAPADNQTEHFADFAFFIEICGCDNGKTASEKYFLDAVKVFHGFFLNLLFLVSAEQKQHRSLLGKLRRTR